MDYAVDLCEVKLGFWPDKHIAPMSFLYELYIQSKAWKRVLPPGGFHRKAEVKECAVFSCLFLSSCESTLEHLQITGVCSTRLAVSNNI